MKRRLIKKYKKQKAFTLIELLAVILILGIIALIAIPTVTSVVEESRKGAFENSVNNITDAIETKCTMELLGTDGITKLYEFNEDGISPSVDIKGSLPKSGYARVNDKCEVLIYAVDGNYKVAKPFSDEKIEVVDKDTTVRPPELAKYDKIEMYKFVNIIDELIIEGVSEDNPIFNFYNNSSFWKEANIGVAIMYNDDFFEDYKNYYIFDNASKYSIKEIEQEIDNLRPIIKEDSLACNNELRDIMHCSVDIEKDFTIMKSEFFVYNDIVFIPSISLPRISEAIRKTPFNDDLLNNIRSSMKDPSGDWEAERVLFFE